MLQLPANLSNKLAETREDVEVEVVTGQLGCNNGSKRSNVENQ